MSGKRKIERIRSQKQYAWQRVNTDTPEHEKEYIESLSLGLRQSQNIHELAAGLSGWLVQYVKLERQRQGTRIVLPGESLN